MTKIDSVYAYLAILWSEVEQIKEPKVPVAILANNDSDAGHKKKKRYTQDRVLCDVVRQTRAKSRQGYKQQETIDAANTTRSESRRGYSKLNIAYLTLRNVAIIESRLTVRLPCVCLPLLLNDKNTSYMESIKPYRWSAMSYKNRVLCTLSSFLKFLSPASLGIYIIHWLGNLHLQKSGKYGYWQARKGR